MRTGGEEACLLPLHTFSFCFRNGFFALAIHSIPAGWRWLSLPNAAGSPVHFFSVSIARAPECLAVTQHLACYNEAVVKLWSTAVSEVKGAVKLPVLIALS